MSLSEGFESIRSANRNRSLVGTPMRLIVTAAVLMLLQGCFSLSRRESTDLTPSRRVGRGAMRNDEHSTDSSHVDKVIYAVVFIAPRDLDYLEYLTQLLRGYDVSAINVEIARIEDLLGRYEKHTHLDQAQLSLLESYRADLAALMMRRDQLQWMGEPI